MHPNSFMARDLFRTSQMRAYDAPPDLLVVGGGTLLCIPPPFRLPFPLTPNRVLRPRSGLCIPNNFDMTPSVTPSPCPSVTVNAVEVERTEHAADVSK